MNATAVRGLLGSLCLLLAVALLVPTGVSLFYSERDVAFGFAACALGSAAAGVLLRIGTREALLNPDGRPAFFRREGLAVVALGWLLGSAIGAAPFLACGATTSFVDALFESTSGFTTSGASIFSGEEIDAHSRGIAFWRAFTHWIGGAGIVLVFVALIPSGGRSLFRAEAKGEADRARVRDSALAILRIYVALTVLHALLLWLAGMDVFDSVFHAFSSMATGGFSNRGASIAYYDSALIEAICIVFMVAAGLNFALWDAFGRHGPRRALRQALRSTEARVYLGLMAGSTLLLTLVLWFSGGGASGELAEYSSFLRCLRDSAFSLVSVQTCTGYATADYDRWPDVCRMILMAAVFVGACSGSTGGGVKVVRIVIVWRAALASVRSFARPRGVHQVMMDQRAVPDEAVASALSYFAIWILVALGGALLMALLGADLTTAVTSVFASLNNVGPGLADVGPAANYGHFDPASKVLLSCLMIAGRLEFYALVALFLPGFWRR